MLDAVAKVMFTKGRNPWNFVSFMYEHWSLYKEMWGACAKIYSNPEVAKLIGDESTKVDAVITFTSCGNYMAHLTNAPLIQWSPPGNPIGMTVYIPFSDDWPFQDPFSPGWSGSVAPTIRAISRTS